LQCTPQNFPIFQFSNSINFFYHINFLLLFQKKIISNFFKIYFIFIYISQQPLFILLLKNKTHTKYRRRRFSEKKNGRKLKKKQVSWEWKACRRKSKGEEKIIEDWHYGHPICFFHLIFVFSTKCESFNDACIYACLWMPISTQYWVFSQISDISLFFSFPVFLVGCIFLSSQTFAIGRDSSSIPSIQVSFCHTGMGIFPAGLPFSI
jgi:hypothetical protein